MMMSFLLVARALARGPIPTDQLRSVASPLGAVVAGVIVIALLVALCARETERDKIEPDPPEETNELDGQFELEDNADDPYYVGGYTPGSRRKGYLGSLGMPGYFLDREELLKAGFDLSQEGKFDWLMPIAIVNNAPDSILVDPNMMIVIQIVHLRTWRMLNSRLAVTDGVAAESRLRELSFEDTLMGGQDAFITPNWVAGQVGEGGWADVPNDPAAVAGDVVIGASQEDEEPTLVGPRGYAISGSLTVAASSELNQAGKKKLRLEATIDPHDSGQVTYNMPGSTSGPAPANRSICIDVDQRVIDGGIPREDGAGFSRDVLLQNLGLKTGPTFHVMAAVLPPQARLKLTGDGAEADNITGVDAFSGLMGDTTDGRSGAGSRLWGEEQNWWEDGRTIGKAETPLALAGGSVDGGGTRDLMDGVVDLPGREDPMAIPDEFGVTDVAGAVCASCGLKMSMGVAVGVKKKEVKGRLPKPGKAKEAKPLPPTPKRSGPLSSPLSGATLDGAIGALASAFDDGDGDMGGQAEPSYAEEPGEEDILGELLGQDRPRMNVSIQRNRRMNVELEGEEGGGTRAPRPTFLDGAPGVSGSGSNQRLLNIPGSGSRLEDIAVDPSSPSAAPPPLATGIRPIPPAPAPLRIPEVASMSGSPGFRPQKQDVKAAASVARLGLAPGKTAAQIAKEKETKLGTFDTQAGSESEFSVFLDVPVELRAHAKVTIESEGGLVQIVRQRGRGNQMQLDLKTNPRKSGNAPFKVKVEAGGKIWEAGGMVKIARPPPQDLSVRSIIGFPNPTDVPVPEEQWTDVHYDALLEPAIPEFRLSARKGTVAAGAKFFPFKLIYQPVNAKSASTTLVVVLGDVEYCFHVTGQPAGFGASKRWGGGKGTAADVGGAVGASGSLSVL